MVGEKKARRRPSLRVRITASSALIIFVAMTTGAIAFVALLENRLIAAQGVATTQQAETIAEQFENSGNIVPPDVADGEVQVFRDGVLIGSSEHDSPLDAVAIEPRTPGADPVRGTWDDDPAVIVAATADIAGVAHLVVVAQEIDDLVIFEGAVGALLVATVPVVSALVAALVWGVVGRALGPVERIRHDVEAIESDDLSQRVSGGGAEDEISRLAETMNRMLERLDLAQRDQRRFVSDASHELRSPIASLRQHAQIALAHPGSTDLGTLAAVVDAESSRLTQLVESLLDLARIDEGRMRNQQVDLDDVVLAEAARQRSISTITVDTSGVTAARISGDPLLLARAVRNLADNARRHASGTMVLSCFPEGSDIVVRVDDDGAGIDEADRSRVFERFVRLDDARSRDAGGAGLGLAIVAGAARAHGGTASVECSPQGGARFEMRLPQ
jgi:signal transduction histidine kinase